jgi:hypothetical protein
MRAEADDRDFFVGVRRKGGVDIAVGVEMRVVQAHRLQFGCEQGSQILLLFGGGAGRGGGIRLGVDQHIAQKALGHGVCEGDGHNQNRATLET